MQETYLRAWRSYHGFEGRSSLRTWLYRIATNACLTALDSRNRRPLPTGLGGPASDPSDPLEQAEILWLEPVPDALVGGDPNDPATVVTARSTVRLALVAALQHLPPRQRATLVLREVMQVPAAEVAEMLGTTVAAVNSSLQRARAQLDAMDVHEDDVVEPDDPAQRALLDHYVRALEAKDVRGIVEAFTADAVWEMPPFTSWYRGAEAIGTPRRRALPGRPRRPAHPADPRQRRPARLRGLPARPGRMGAVPAAGAHRHRRPHLARRRVLRHHPVRHVRPARPPSPGRMTGRPVAPGRAAGHGGRGLRTARTRHGLHARQPRPGQSGADDGSHALCPVGPAPAAPAHGRVAAHAARGDRRGPPRPVRRRAGRTPTTATPSPTRSAPCAAAPAG